jgi:hypothetical protein
MSPASTIRWARALQRERVHSLFMGFPKPEPFDAFSSHHLKPHGVAFPMTTCSIFRGRALRAVS